MCSQETNGKGSNTSSFHFTERWYVSEEEEDDKEEFFRVKSLTVNSLPDNFHRDSVKTYPGERAKTERMSRVKGYSLEEKMKQRHRSSSVSREGEEWAKQYSKKVTDNTLEHIHDTVVVANSIVLKSASINEELGRQERVLSNAEKDISAAEYDTDVTSRTLKGMSSLGGKIANTLSTRKPKKKIKVSSEINFALINGELGLCAYSRMGSTESYYSNTGTESSVHTAEHQIKAGIGQLHNALDVIKIHQLETAWALERQEGRFSVFEDKMDTTNKRLYNQNKMINKITSKSNMTVRV